jgi:hypothetical protein
MELRQKYAEMACCLNYFLNKGFLLPEVWL